jgi:hypothetical protein
LRIVWAKLMIDKCETDELKPFAGEVSGKIFKKS